VSPPETILAASVVIITASVVIPIGRAIARRIAGGSGGSDAHREVADLRDEVAELREETGTIRRELSEAHERLDFAERLLAQVKDRPALPGAR
jgi:hypothetical protein